MLLFLKCFANLCVEKTSLIIPASICHSSSKLFVNICQFECNIGGVIAAWSGLGVLCVGDYFVDLWRILCMSMSVLDT